MKTRRQLGTESISPVIRKKTSRAARKELSGSETVEYHTNAGVSNFRGPDSRNKTPKLSRKKELKAQTPGRDDILCSQHFDSQTVVGWDCNSPASVRNITERKNVLDGENDGVEDLISQLIGEEQEEDILAHRNTPPLLGLWRDKSKINQDGPSGVRHRLRKRAGRQRKKSAVSSVSRELLDKLTNALNSCSDVDKETEGRNAEGELYLNEITEVDEQLQENRDLTVVHNVSKDLFESYKEETLESDRQQAVKLSTVDKQRDNKGSVEISDSIADTTWSDDELFGNDSFIVYATQVTTGKNDKKSTPVVGLKRKSNDKELPKSKCSRYTLKKREDLEEKKKPECEVRPETYTTLVSRQNNSNSFVTKNSNFDPKTGQHFHQSSSSSRGSVTTVTSSNASMNSLTSGSKQSTDYNKNVISNSSTVSSVGQKSCSSGRLVSPTVKMPTRSGVIKVPDESMSNNHKMGTSSFSRSGSFKKHNSFTGPEQLKNPAVLNRQRSLSGNHHQQNFTKHAGLNQNTSNQCVNQNHLNRQMVGQVGKDKSNLNNSTFLNTFVNSFSDHIQKDTNHQNRNSYTFKGVTRNNPHVKSSSRTGHAQHSAVMGSHKSFPVSKDKPASGVVATSVNKIEKVINEINKFPSRPRPVLCKGSANLVVPQHKNRIETSAFKGSAGDLDTSLSDDLLCQLAEPDEVLDSEINVKANKEMLDDKCNSSTDKRLQITRKTVSTQNSMSKDVASKKESVKKKFTFKPSQKVDNPTNATDIQSKLKSKSVSQFKEHTIQNVMTGKDSAKNKDLSAKPRKPAETSTCKIATNSNQSKEETTKSNLIKDNVFSEDLFSDDDDLLTGSDGLTEAQIFAMLDEAELMATQKLNETSYSPKQNRGGKSGTLTCHVNAAKISSNKQDNPSQLQQNVKLDKGHVTGASDELFLSEMEETKTKCQDRLSGSQDQPSSQGHKSSQGHPSSQGQVSSSQGQMTSSQVKYSAAEIERKKQLALERRQQKLRNSQVVKK